jgi:protein phosphatase 1L
MRFPREWARCVRVFLRLLTARCSHLWVILLLVLVGWLLFRLTSGDSFISPSSRVLVPNVLFPYGVEDHIGRRMHMEDRFVAAAELAGDWSQSVYAVFDGHGGSHAAEFMRVHLPRMLQSALVGGEDPPLALTHAFEAADTEVSCCCACCCFAWLVDSVVQFLRVAQQRVSPWDDGSTAVAAFVRGEDLWVANTGDSRAVLVSGKGRSVALSEDHKPNRPDERERIVLAGGEVIHIGVWRVQGILAVSRAIGDRLLKSLVPATPEVTRHKLTPDDAFLVLATDGLWDVVSTEEVGSFVYRCSAPQVAATTLVRLALTRGTLDNVTVLVVDLRASSRRVASARPPSSRVADAARAVDRPGSDGARPRVTVPRK